MSMLRFAFLVALTACGPTAAEVRLRSVDRARVDAAAQPGARQLQGLADAIHTAYRAGDYKHQPAALTAQVAEAIRLIDRAVTQPSVDNATLIAWKGLLQIDAGDAAPGFASLQESFALAPNAMAGRSLIVIYGTANRRDDLSRVCRATFHAIDRADDRVDVITLCRHHMNAASIDGEIAWMDPQIAAWYRDELTRREDAQRVADEQARRERRVVRQTEQCAASCKETGLRCQNRCGGDRSCDQRCVEINHACLDRCESVAYEKLDR